MLPWGPWLTMSTTACRQGWDDAVGAAWRRRQAVQGWECNAEAKADLHLLPHVAPPPHPPLITQHISSPASTLPRPSPARATSPAGGPLSRGRRWHAPTSPPLPALGSVVHRVGGGVAEEGGRGGWKGLAAKAGGPGWPTLRGMIRGWEVSYGSYLGGLPTPQHCRPTRTCISSSTRFCSAWRTAHPPSPPASACGL